MNSKKAFTLIELLIVVAIIAILAAIAVPNFLEAQTRAKVSRVKNDFRTLKTGMEAYRVDNNDYILDSGGPEAEDRAYKMLTTPIAYMTTIPFSPFLDIPQQYGRQRYYEYWRGWGPPYDPGIVQYNIHYRITSVGPDNLCDFGLGFSCFPEPIAKMSPEFVNGLYDATNGTKSRGDLIATSQMIY
jgi:prepilin-type N-terminal cleavage/methylation domain-containing protein